MVETAAMLSSRRKKRRLNYVRYILQKPKPVKGLFNGDSPRPESGNYRGDWYRPERSQQIPPRTGMNPPRSRLTLDGFVLKNGSVRYGSKLDRLLVSYGNPRNHKGVRNGQNFLTDHQHNVVVKAWMPSMVSFGVQYGNGYNCHPAVPTSYAGGPAIPSMNAEDLALTPWGALGWSRARPGNPSANMAQFFGELRRPPNIPLIGLYRSASRFRALGSEYLNAVFGWVPFLRDLRQFYETQHKLETQVDQLMRNNGRPVRRRRTLSNVTSVTVSEGYKAIPFWNSWAYIPGCVGRMSGHTHWNTVTTTTTKIWFVASFRYYMRGMGTNGWYANVRRHLFGGTLTPSLVWELTPWSWFADYFGNVGAIATNLSNNAVDNLTADYAFVMREVITTTHHESVTSWSKRVDSFNSWEAGSLRTSYTSTYTKRTRLVASPYGFGSTFGGLSAYQGSVLAALGISRSRFRA